MPRRHVSGWELLGHETDPTPGDPDAVRRVATAYSGIAEQAERAHQLLRGERIRDGAGDAMRELNARVDELPDQLRRTYESFRRVGDAYRGYAETLVSSQDLLDQAIDRAQAVHRTATLELPDTPPSEAPPSEVQEHDRQTTRINAARTELGAAERLAAEARSLREDGGADGPGSRQVARELDEAAALAIEERDLWDRAVDLFDDAGEAIDQFFKDHPWLETVLQIAVGILTIAFPVLGLILGAVLLLVQAWRMAATGNWDITALAIGVLSLASGGIIRALALAGRLGPVATILRAMSTRTGGMRNAVTSATAGLRSASRTIGRGLGDGPAGPARPTAAGCWRGARLAGRRRRSRGGGSSAHAGRRRPWACRVVPTCRGRGPPPVPVVADWPIGSTGSEGVRLDLARRAAAATGPPPPVRPAPPAPRRTRRDLSRYHRRLPGGRGDAADRRAGGGRHRPRRNDGDRWRRRLRRTAHAGRRRTVRLHAGRGRSPHAGRGGSPRVRRPTRPRAQWPATRRGFGVGSGAGREGSPLVRRAAAPPAGVESDGPAAAGVRGPSEPPPPPVTVVSPRSVPTAACWAWAAWPRPPGSRPWGWLSADRVRRGAGGTGPSRGRPRRRRARPRQDTGPPPSPWIRSANPRPPARWREHDPQAETVPGRATWMPVSTTASGSAPSATLPGRREHPERPADPAGPSPESAARSSGRRERQPRGSGAGDGVAHAPGAGAHRAQDGGHRAEPPGQGEGADDPPARTRPIASAVMSQFPVAAIRQAWTSSSTAPRISPSTGTRS